MPEMILFSKTQLRQFIEITPGSNTLINICNLKLMTATITGRASFFDGQSLPDSWTVNLCVQVSAQLLIGSRPEKTLKLGLLSSSYINSTKEVQEKEVPQHFHNRSCCLWVQPDETLARAVALLQFR